MNRLLAQTNIPLNFLPDKWKNLTNCIVGPLPAGQTRCDFTPSLLISTLLPNILVLAGVIFFFLILGGGFMMISGAGKESSAQDKAKAQAAITYGVIGFLLVVSAYFILQIVGVITGINFITPPSI